MGDLRRARMSPEIVCGQIRFYEGDQFKIDLVLELTDQDQTPVELTQTDTVQLVILDRRRKTVWSKTYNGITNNTITVDVDEAMAGMMTKGMYSYRVIVSHGGTVTTVAADNIIMVR